jgi:hypothetical protein
MKSMSVLAFTLIGLLLTAPVTSQQRRRDRATAITHDNRALPDWDARVGKATALDITRRLFPGGDSDDDDTYALGQQKVLRIPGTSKERSILPKGSHLHPPTVVPVRGQGKRFFVLM